MAPVRAVATAPKANQVAYTTNPNGTITLSAKIMMLKRFRGRKGLGCGGRDPCGGADADTEASRECVKQLPRPT